MFNFYAWIFIAFFIVLYLIGDAKGGDKEDGN